MYITYQSKLRSSLNCAFTDKNGRFRFREVLLKRLIDRKDGTINLQRQSVQGEMVLRREIIVRDRKRNWLRELV